MGTVPHSLVIDRTQHMQIKTIKVNNFYSDTVPPKREEMKERDALPRAARPAVVCG